MRAGHANEDYLISRPQLTNTVDNRHAAQRPAFTRLIDDFRQRFSVMPG